MDRVRSLFIFKVKGQISRSLGLYKKFWHLDLCGQDIARTIWHMMLKLIVYTLYGQRKKPIYFQGQISRSLGLYKEFWHLDPCWQDIARTIWHRMLKLCVYFIWTEEETYLFSRSKLKFQGHWAYYLA